MTTADDTTDRPTWRGTLSDLRTITNPVDQIKAADAFIAMCERQAAKATNRGDTGFVGLARRRAAEAGAIHDAAENEMRARDADSSI